MTNLEEPSAYLGRCEHVDIDHPLIQQQARALREQSSNQLELARNTFNFVRDEISHSYDVQAQEVTCKASDVLGHKTGVCFAKSHLAAALLRANGLPTALRYQRLFMDDHQLFGLHGLNAVYLDGFDWYVFDARGNKQGVSTSFSPPEVQYAFELKPGEDLIDEFYQSPLPEVLDLLETSENMQEVDQGISKLGAVFA